MGNIKRRRKNNANSLLALRSRHEIFDLQTRCPSLLEVCLVFGGVCCCSCFVLSSQGAHSAVTKIIFEIVGKKIACERQQENGGCPPPASRRTPGSCRAHQHPPARLLAGISAGEGTLLELLSCICLGKQTNIFFFQAAVFITV